MKKAVLAIAIFYTLLLGSVLGQHCKCPNCPPPGHAGACCHWVHSDPPGPNDHGICQVKQWSNETCTPSYGTWCLASWTHDPTPAPTRAPTVPSPAPTFRPTSRPTPGPTHRHGP